MALAPGWSAGDEGAATSWPALLPAAAAAVAAAAACAGPADCEASEVGAWPVRALKAADTHFISLFAPGGIRGSAATVRG